MMSSLSFFRRLSGYKIALLGIGLFLLDMVTKMLALHYLAAAPSATGMGVEREIIVFQNVIGIDFTLTYAINKGAAWGCFGNFPYLLLALRLVLIGALFVYLLFFQAPQNYRLPLTLILSGALGNVCDFFLYGHVIDMIHFVFWGYDYPVFNVADSLIFLGTCMILFNTMRHKES